MDGLDVPAEAAARQGEARTITVVECEVLMGERAFTEPSPSDWERIEQRILAGENFQDAANAEGQTTSSLKRQDRVRHAELKALWHEVQGFADRTTSRDTLREIATDTAVQSGDRVRAAEQLGKSSGYLGDSVHVDIEHSGGVEVTVEHDFSGILDELERVGLLARGATGALDAETLALLPARTD